MYKLNKDNKILLLAFLIIIGALISSSIESITGKVINKKITKLSVSPELTYPGKQVYVTVVPGEEGVNEEVIFCDINGNKLDSTNICQGSYKCEESSTFSFNIPQNWESGIHKVKVYDYALKDFIINDFTIGGN